MHLPLERIRFRLMPRQIIAADRRGARWRHVNANSDALQLRARSRIKLHNKRIMSGNDMALVRRQCQQPLESLWRRCYTSHNSYLTKGRQRIFAPRSMDFTSGAIATNPPARLS